MGDLLIIGACLNLFIKHAIDKEYISIKWNTFLLVGGLISYFLLSYVLDFFNLAKVANRRYILSQSIYITALFTFLIFFFTLITLDAGFWRIPLLSFLILTPFQIGLWRLLFGNLFRIIPVTKNVLYLYDLQSEETLKEDIRAINGNELQSFYKVKLTQLIENESFLEKNLFLNASDKIDAIIINCNEYQKLPKALDRHLVNAMVYGKEVISFASFYENTYEALPLQSNNDSYYEILRLKNKKIRYIQLLFSFGVNLILSITTGAVFVIVTPFVWFFNIFFNPGPLFYTQFRVGRFGREFKIFKFRSMVTNAEKKGAQMATKNDARITPFGKILRMFRIDELPQILSVIRGDMQFIGPRPERKVFVDKLNQANPFYNSRHLIKPGITGWAQVKFKYGENLEDSFKKLEYDLYYIKNKSITLDMRIIFKTMTTVLFSRGV